MNKQFIIITGPTGVGKSALAEQLAPHIHGEIVNADMGQFYSPLSIGTAKPDYKKSPIPHHLFDIIDKPVSFSVADYRKRAVVVMEEIWQRGNMPIIVGGSSFYIRSLFFPPQEPEINFQTEALEIPQELLWHKLQEVDPERAKQLHPHDIYRIKRALAIWQQTGQKPSSMQPPFMMPGDECFIFFVLRDRQELYKIINERVVAMINAGLVHEVEQLDDAWRTFLQEKKIIGYPEVIEFLEHHLSHEKMIEQIQQKTRNYAKRQYSFWRSFKESIAPYEQNNRFKIFEPNLTLLDLPLYIKQLLPLFIKGVS